MKTIVVIFLVFTLCKGFNGYSQSSKEIKLIQAGYAIKDLSKKMNFNNAKLACKRFGKEWRLPTYDQFQKIEFALIDIGNTRSDDYDFFWCTIQGEATPSNETNAWQAHEPSNLYSVRCVRRLRPSEMGE